MSSLSERKKPNILVVQHSENAPCNTFCQGLMEEGALIDRLFPEQQSLPAAADAFDGLVVLGGPQHAIDDTAGPHFRQLMGLMQDFDRNHKPVAGICLGCQLLARAYSGQPYQLGTLEFGFVQHRLTKAGRKDKIFHDLELPAVMEFHEDTFELPAGGELLIAGEKCPNQCFKVGNVSYGFQFHLEVHLAQALEWVELFEAGDIATYHKYLPCFTSDYFTSLRSALPEYLKHSERFCKEVAVRWLDLARQATASELPIEHIDHIEH